MNNILENRDIVLFLGAGFSAKTGLPCISGFGKACKDEHIALKKHMKPKYYRNAAPMLIESFKVFKLFQNYCKKSKIAKDIQNMEHIFGIAEILKESGIKHIKLGGFLYSIQELISHIQLTLWKIYHITHLAKINDHGEYTNIRKDIYEPFFQQIIDHAERLTIITTNYDLNIEYLIYNSVSSDARCIYPIINNRYKKSIIAGQRTDEDMKDSNFRYVEYLHKSVESSSHKEEIITLGSNKNTSPLLCKLHGSINYFYDFKKGNKEQIYIADDLGNNESIGSSEAFKDEPSLLAVDAIWNLQNKYGRSLIPAIIPPTYSKLAGYEWLEQIWNTAILTLAKAKKIIFIGYSFTETDGFMRAMMQGAMAMRVSKTFPEIHVIDMSPKTRKRYRNLFNVAPKKIKTYNKTLEEAVKENIIEKCFKS